VSDDPQGGHDPRGPRDRAPHHPQSPQSPQDSQNPPGPPGPREAPDRGPQGEDRAGPRPLSGIELARQALAQARADALKRGTLPGQGRRKAARPRPVREAGRGGDPKPFAAAIRDLLADRGWETRAAVGRVFGDWPRIVGPELARHTKPERFEDGTLTVAADSTAWATQVRLLAGQLVKRLNQELGQGTVTRVKVVGPSSGPRRPGAWRVR